MGEAGDYSTLGTSTQQVNGIRPIRITHAPL
jgi:hypothetical protein